MAYGAKNEKINLPPLTKLQKISILWLGYGIYRRKYGTCGAGMA
jgi:hypothetical protein